MIVKKDVKNIIRHNIIIIQNFSYMALLQFFNMVLPLIIFPYLIRTLGVDTYGLVVFAQAIIAYLVVLVSFGFNLSATKVVSIHRKNNKKLSEIVSSVLIIKSGIFILTFVLLTVLLNFIPQAKGQIDLFLLTMWLCVYEVIFPIWYFQGIEKMKYITIITLISRSCLLGLILVVIKSPADYLWVPVINGIGALLAGVISLYVVFKRHKIKLSMQSYSTLYSYVNESIPFFVSNLSVKIYVASSKVLVGSFLGMLEVAYYDLAEKIALVVKTPQGILGQVLFPKVNMDKDKIFVKKIFKISVLLNFLLITLVFIFSKYIVLWLGGEAMIDSIIIVNILCLTAPLVAMSNVFGIQLLIPFGFKRVFSRVIIVSSLIYFLQAFFVWYFIGFSVVNLSVIFVSTELFVTVMMFYYCKKYKLWI